MAENEIPESLRKHLFHPHNPGENPRADGVARADNSCSETLEVSLEMESDRVIRAGFWARACLHVVACGSAVAALAEGRDLAELKDIDADAIDAALGGLPTEEKHCAAFAATVLRKAVLDYLDKRRQDSWMRLYR